MAFAGGLLARKANIGASFRATAAKTLDGHPKVLKSLLEHYSLDESATSTLTDDEALINVLKFISDAAFFVPAVEMAANFAKDAFVLFFNEPNPWDGLFKGHSSHILDVAFLLQNYNEYLDEAQKASAITFATDVITFVNGQSPWESFNGGRNVAASYANGKKTVSELSVSEHTGRSSFILDIGKEESGPGMDALMQIVTKFLKG